jgi:DNA-binding IscR family transcriptional regulator
MQIGTRFSVAVHILLLVEVFRDECRVTSGFIASSVNTNPVVIRRIMGLLRDAGLIEIAAGTGGVRLTRKPHEISLLDVYRAAGPVKHGALFRIHGDAAPGCPVGGHIADLLGNLFQDAQRAMEDDLAKHGLDEALARLSDLGKRRRR